MRSVITFARKIELRLVVFALVITAGQIVFATICARGDSWGQRYLSLWTFDGGWYADILENGYRTTDPPNTEGHASNVAFFPAYPIAARWVGKLFGLTPAYALLFTAQFAAALFWWLLLRFLANWDVASSVTMAVVMLIFCHPTAFYLVVTYADSLFMAALLALLAWGPRAGNSVPCMIGAAVAGYVTSTTRIVGAPLAALPVLWEWNELWPALKARTRFLTVLLRSVPYMLVSIATAFGTISFFIYCALRFGYWDLYMRTRAAGWGVSKTDYTAMFAPSNFNVSLPRFDQDLISPVQVSHLYVAVVVLALVLIPALDYWFSRRQAGGNALSQRAPFYLAAWLLFFFSASGSGLPQGSYLGFLRYGFYSEVPLLLGLAHLHRQGSAGKAELSPSAQMAIFLACAVGLAMQSHFCRLYSHAVIVS